MRPNIQLVPAILGPCLLVPIEILAVIAELRPGSVPCGIDDPLKPIDGVSAEIHRFEART